MPLDYANKGDMQSYLPRLISMFDESEDAGRAMREKAARDVDYYDGKQWTDAEVEALRRRGQPADQYNVIRDKVDYWQGLEKDQRTDPRALPRTPQHEQEASAATDALRFIAEDNDWNSTRSAVWGDILKAGWGGVELVAEPEGVKRGEFMASTSMTQPQTEYAIRARRTPWDRMFWDPASYMSDFSDARYMGEVVWMDREAAIKSYGKGADAVYDETVSMFQSGNTFDDKPTNWRWISRDRKRIRVIKMYHLEDDGWRFCEFTRGGILKAGPSPWLDDEGEPTHGYVWASANTDRDNNRYGAIRDMVPLQDSINKRLSKFLHLVSVRQTFGTDGAGPDANEFRKQLARPDGHLAFPVGMEFGKNFGVIPTGDMAGGQFELLQNSLAMFQGMGPNADMMGDGDKGSSGRAILANQQGGFIQLGTLFDTLRSLDRRAFRRMWMLVRQFWTAAKWVRVTDDERNLQWVGLNIPQMDPMTGQVQVQNAVAELDVDIIIDEAPDSANIQAEQFEQLTNLAQAGVVFPPTVYIKASALRNKSELLKELEDAQAAQQQAAPPDPRQIAAEAKQAELQAGLQADAQRNGMELQHKRDLAEMDLFYKAASRQQDMQAKDADRTMQREAPTGDVDQQQTIAIVETLAAMTAALQGIANQFTPQQTA
jgi:hypothetical protein